MKQKLAEGDDETARKLAEKALQIKPRHEETQDVLLHLQTKAQDWAGARSTLTAKLKSGTLPRDVYKRRDAVLALFASKPDAGVDAARRVARSLEQVQQEIISRGLPAPGFGLGLCTGEVVFGAVGGLNQIRVGAIGDTLNLASRLP